MRYLIFATPEGKLIIQRLILDRLYWESYSNLALPEFKKIKINDRYRQEED
jgi:hypothetical protein